MAGRSTTPLTSNPLYFEDSTDPATRPTPVLPRPLYKPQGQVLTVRRAREQA